MNIGGVIFGILIEFGAFAVTKPLVDLIIPQSEIDKIDAIGQWAKDELEQREAERGTDG